MHVLRQARAGALTPEAVASLGTQAHLAALARVAGLARAHAADVGAPGAVGTAAGLATVHAVGAHRTLLLAPAPRGGGGGWGAWSGEGREVSDQREWKCQRFSCK